MDADVVLAVTTRGGEIDCIHYGSVVVVNKFGDILFSSGNPKKLVFDRSLPKPYKAIAVLISGAASRYDYGPEEIAIISGSHSGSQVHVTRLADMLAKLNLPISKLKCGAKLPLGTDAINDLIVNNDSVISELHSDCSGEHIGILSICKNNGWSIDHYTSSNHPVQAYLREIVDSFIDFPSSMFTLDGCGLPTYYVPLINLAKGMANLTSEKIYGVSAKKVIDHIRTHPVLYGGETGRFDTNIIQASKGTIVSKSAAEGLFALAFIPKGVGLAIKIGDGNHRAALPAIWDIIERLKLCTTSELDQIVDQTVEYIRSNDGTKVGEVVSMVP